MTKCNFTSDLFAPVKCKKIEISTDGAGISSDAGVLLLREIDRKLNITNQIASRIPDARNQASCIPAIPNYVGGLTPSAT